MSNNGKLEAKITVPSGGWSLSLSDSGGGPWTVSLTAGNEYYLSSVAPGGSVDFLAAVKAALDASPSSITYAVDGDLDENGTGQITISRSSGTATTFSITWTSTDWRDLLGFTGNISAVSTSTGANHAKSLWLGPHTPMSGAGFLKAGFPHVIGRRTISPAGDTKIRVASGHTRNWLKWEAVQVEKALLEYETQNSGKTNQSFERFWSEGLGGGTVGLASWASSVFRWHPSADTDGTYFTYTAPVQGLQLQRLRETYGGLWVVDLQDLVVPRGET